MGLKFSTKKPHATETRGGISFGRVQKLFTIKEIGDTSSNIHKKKHKHNDTNT